MIVPVDDMTAAQRSGEHVGRTRRRAPTRPISTRPEADKSIWPHVHPRLLELIRAHRTTHRVLQRAPHWPNGSPRTSTSSRARSSSRAHHGSLSREQRLAGRVRPQGRPPARRSSRPVSLELGIDMGTVDLVVLVESPGSVSRGLQRIGRAGHQVGEPSTGKIFPKYRGDLLEAAVVVQRMRDGLVEEMRYPRNPLDVLAQQIVAAAALDEWDVDDLARARPPGRELRRPLRRRASARRSTCSPGRYPSDQFAGLRPRVVWDRVAGPRARPAKARSASRSRAAARSPTAGCSACSSPTARASASSTRRWSTRAASARPSCSARRRGASRRSPSTGSSSRPRRASPAKTPFWQGDKPGRPLELGRALGALVRELRATVRDDAEAAPHARAGSTRAPPSNLRAYLDEQAEATGAVPDDRTIVVERFPDEIGDWRVCILTPFGARVHAPWALAIEERLAAARPRRCRCCGATTASSAACPSRSTRSRSTCCSSTPTRSRSSSSRGCRARRCSRRGSARTRRARCCSRAAGPASARRCGSSASGRPTCSRSRRATRRSRSCWRRRASASATCSTCRRCARCSPTSARAQVRVVPVETRHASPFAQSPAVRMDRGLHVRGRRAARRAAGRRARARPRPPARPARRRGAPRAARPGGASPSSSSSCSGSRPNARPATPTTSTTCSPTSARSPTTRSRRARAADPARVDRRRCSHERRAIEVGRGRPDRRGRGRGAAARRARCRDPGRACRARSPTRCRSRSTTSSPRYARTHVPFLRRRRRGAARGHRRTRARGARSGSRPTGRVVHGEFRPGGVETRVVRRRRAAVAAPALARRAAPRGRAGRRAHVRAVPVGVAGRRPRPARHRRARRSARAAAGRRDPGVGARTRRAARRASRATGPRCSTSCARRASSCGSGAGALGADDGRVRLFFRDRVQLLAPSVTLAGAARRPGARRDPRRTSRPRARRSGPISSPPRAPPTTRCCSPRCGTWCGRARSPTTRSARCACRAARPRKRVGPRAGRIPGGWRGSARPRARDGGRWSRRCSNPRRRRPRPRTPSPSNCSSGTAW